MRPAIVLLSAAVALLASTATTGAREVDKRFHESFDVREGVTLRLEYGDGDVTITPWDEDVIDVEVRYRADIQAVGIGSDEDFEVEFDQSDDRVTVRGMERGPRLFFIVRRVQYEYTYTIKAPPYVILDLRGDDGDLELSNWRGDIECRTDDGDVKMTDVDNANTEIRIEDGDVRLSGLECDLIVKSDDGDITLFKSTVPHSLFSTEDGDVRVVDCAGSFDASLDDGDVTMNRVTASVVNVNGNDGDVDLELTSDDDIHINVNMDDGDVSIRLAGGLAFSYLVTFDDGYVTVDLEGATDTESSEHRVSGRVGEGGGLVRISTADGDVDLTNAP